VFELDSFSVTHASKYPSPVLSLGLSPDCRLLAVGMADGTLSVRTHDRPRAATAAPGLPAPRARCGRALPSLDDAADRCYDTLN
jgi:hypothetical protein